ncbi:granzyme G-like isoform X1 [Lates calcarifer]|uniref:trypsin n=1 Tax=Lates calcarifer TaxID=8187 RepID=A0AAJ7Q470_LATCA|nr:granzyme G-like isoform X1 [Lates calcarifer]
MFFHCELVVLILALTLNGQVHTGEIYGGHEAKPHSRPYMVLLERHMQNGQTSYCGGFLLNKYFVMTAAHCQAKSYTALLGVHNACNCAGVQRIPVKAAFPHKDYNETEYTNDIMLLKLSSKAHFNNNVSRIALAGRGDGSLPKSCSVSGWGRTNKYNKTVPFKLMEVNVTLTDNELCCQKKVYCSEGKAGPAEGDSGGPLVCKDGKAYGVVGTSFQSNPEIYPYAKIPENADWINWITGNNEKF